MRRNLFCTGSGLGELFSPETLPKTRRIFWPCAQSDATYYIWAFERRFNRARPYEIEPRIERLETPNFPAYPSAHSANSWTAAYVFQELMPEDRDVFARGAAELRVFAEILGVHFPGDSESGRALARQVVDRLLASAEFRKDLAEARDEIAAAKRSRNSAPRLPAASSHGTRKEECFSVSTAEPGRSGRVRRQALQATAERKGSALAAPPRISAIRAAMSVPWERSGARPSCARCRRG